MKKSPFNNGAKKTPTDIRQQVSSLEAFLELFPPVEVARHENMKTTTQGTPEGASLPISGSPTPLETFTTEEHDFLSTVPDTLIFEIGIGQKDAFGGSHSSPSRLVVRLQEPFKALAFAQGTLKMTVISCILNGVTQDITKPVDLQPFVDNKRFFATTRTPKPKKIIQPEPEAASSPPELSDEVRKAITTAKRGKGPAATR